MKTLPMVASNVARRLYAPSRRSPASPDRSPAPTNPLWCDPGKRPRRTHSRTVGDCCQASLKAWSDSGHSVRLRYLRRPFCRLLRLSTGRRRQAASGAGAYPRSQRNRLLGANSTTIMKGAKNNRIPRLWNRDRSLRVKIGTEEAGQSVVRLERWARGLFLRCAPRRYFGLVGELRPLLGKREPCRLADLVYGRFCPLPALPCGQAVAAGRAHWPVFRPPTCDAFSAPVSRRTEGAGFSKSRRMPSTGLTGMVGTIP
jgi:hypothetical protein